MSLKINNNAQALNGYRNLNRNDNVLGNTLERLSSGLRINRAADDAAGLVISEQLRAQIVGLERGISNTETAVNMVQTAEGSLDEMNTLLKKVRDLALHAANTATNDVSQLQADQSELDNAIQSITRISQTTQFGTKKLLDGTLAGANSYDTTKIHKFDVGSGLLTRADFTPGTVSLVIDSSAETSTTFKTASTVTLVGIIESSTSIGTLANGSTFSAVTGASVLSQSLGGFFASGAAAETIDTGSTQAMILRVEDNYYSLEVNSFSGGNFVSWANTTQSTYMFSQAASGLVITRTSTGAVGAQRDLAFAIRLGSFSATDNSGIAKSFEFALNSAFSLTSFGHNQATVIKTSGSATFTGGFSVMGGSQGESTTVFITGNGSVLTDSVMRTTLGNGTTRLNTGASMTLTVAGKDYTFANNESINDMLSYINSQQTEYKIEADRDYGITMQRTRLGNGGSETDLRIRISDATGRQSTMTQLGSTEVEFSTGTGTVPSANDGGIDKGVNINAHIEGSNIPGQRINLNSTGDDASILKNNAYGIIVDLATDFAKTAGSVAANMTRGALFQVGPNNSQLTGVDIKDTSAIKLGLGGDSTNTLRSLQSLVDKQALVNGYTKEALNVIDKAIDDVTTMRGALGAFQANTLETNLSSLRVTHENLTSAESTIRDADFAKESANFAKQQILVSASTSMLAQANQLPQSVLQLLGS